MDQTRRQLLTLVGGSVSLPLAGCGAFIDPATETDVSESDDPTDSEMATASSPTPTATLEPVASTTTVTATPKPTTPSRDSTPTPDTPTPTVTEQFEAVSTPTRIAAADGDAGDQFGNGELSADGTTAVIGAPTDEDPNGDDAGAAYVFERETDGWTQQAKIAADTGWAPALFGLSAGLSADGSRIVVGAPLRSSRGTVGGGGAYVFGRSSETWGQEAAIRPDSVEGGDFFGAVVRMTDDGETVLIGAPREQTPSGEASGSAYVFTRGRSGWEQQTKLTASDGDARDQFGSSMALSASGDHAVVGAFHDEDPNGDRAGSMYVFERGDSAWQQRAKLAPDGGQRGEEFPTALSISNDGSTILASRMNDDPNGTDSGSVVVFSTASPSHRWTQTATLTPDDSDAGDSFGTALALSADGTQAVVGASRDEDPNGDNGGSAYRFEHVDGEWVQQAKLAPAVCDDGDRFGSHTSMAAGGTPILVGSMHDEDPNGTNAGSCYVYE